FACNELNTRLGKCLFHSLPIVICGSCAVTFFIRVFFFVWNFLECIKNVLLFTKTYEKMNHPCVYLRNILGSLIHILHNKRTIIIIILNACLILNVLLSTYIL